MFIALLGLIAVIALAAMATVALVVSFLVICMAGSYLRERCGKIGHSRFNESKAVAKAAKQWPDYYPQDWNLENGKKN
jgi:amino acid transporter